MGLDHSGGLKIAGYLVDIVLRETSVSVPSNAKVGPRRPCECCVTGAVFDERLCFRTIEGQSLFYVTQNSFTLHYVDLHCMGGLHPPVEFLSG